MGTNKFYITKAKYDALIDEIKYLEGEGAAKLARLLASSPGSGMGRPNDLPAHIFAGELMGYLQEIKTVIRHAEIIDELRERDQDPNLVVLGSTVYVRYDDEDEVVEYTILGQQEVDIANGRISCFSPVGSSLMGKRKGDIVNAKTPGSFRDIRMKIINIERKSINFRYETTIWKNKLETMLE